MTPTLSSNGLRLRCPEGHLLYWHRADPDFDYGRHGNRNGLCTALDYWNQDAASNSRAAGRLRRAVQPDLLLSGTGVAQVQWLLADGTLVPNVVVWCRRQHGVGQALPEPDSAQPVEAYFERLRSMLDELGWTVEPVECPEHRAERAEVTAALGRLRAAESRGFARPDARPDEAAGEASLSDPDPDPPAPGLF